MSEVWEKVFARQRTIWGEAPTRSAERAADDFARRGVKDVLIPGIGYGRNAKPFLERGLAVSGIEISETAIGLARSELGLDLPIVHGSVTDMPFDDRRYGGIYSFGLIYLLDAAQRAKLLRDCHRQLVPGGPMVFTVISKSWPMFGQGTRLAEDWYETAPGVRLFFFDAESIAREFGPYGVMEVAEVEEPQHDGSLRPFVHIVCSAST